jgi:hypothetical protein
VTSTLKVTGAAVVALGVGVVAALHQCSDDEGMTSERWNPTLLLLAAGIVGATLLAHRPWALWVALAFVPPWISLVDCVANDPTPDGLEVFWVPTEAVVTGIAGALAFALHRVLAR